MAARRKKARTRAGLRRDSGDPLLPAVLAATEDIVSAPAGIGAATGGGAVAVVSRAGPRFVKSEVVA